jgi:hypothetical protein
MRRFGASILLLLAGCAPAATDTSGAGSAAADQPSSGGGPTTQSGRPSAPGLPGGGGPNAGPGRRMGAAAVGGSYTTGGVLTSTLGSTGNATWLGGNHVDIRGQLVRDDLLELQITETGTGWMESFLVGLPPMPQSAPVPLLVLFHKFGATHWDTLFNTSFFDEARARNWFVVAPLSAASKHFGSPQAQANTQLVLESVLDLYGSEIDRNRIYGVGFSMGGGALLAYAARHVDADGPMFAALVSHTGGGALWHTYGTSPDDDDSDDNWQTGQNLETPDILDFWFGGPPEQFPFTYQRYSVMDISPLGIANYDTSLITNLKHVPIHSWYAVNDPQIFLVALTDRIWNEFLTFYGGASVLTQVQGTAHTWHTLDDAAVCDWLAQYTLQLPSSGSTLADDDGKWFYFDVQQDAPGSFTRFDWDVDGPADTLTLGGTRNLQRVIVDTVAAGLDPASNLTLNLSTADATGDIVRFTDIASAPLDVLRDGVSDPGWVYDAQTLTLTITELDGGPHQWVVLLP